MPEVACNISFAHRVTSIVETAPRAEPTSYMRCTHGCFPLDLVSFSQFAIRAWREAREKEPLLEDRPLHLWRLAVPTASHEAGAADS